jgi:transcriptional regulator with XRE-family HTH domain
MRGEIMDSIKTGALIAELRKSKNLTQTDLAKMLNISNRTVSKWENGDGFPDISILPEIAKLLGITVDELLQGELNESSEATVEQPKFICEFQETVKDYSKLFKIYLNSKIPIWLVVLLFLDILSMIALCTVSNIIPRAVVIVYCVLLAILLLVLAIMPQACARIQINQSKSLNNGEKMPTRYEISDKLRIVEGSIKQEFAINNITGFYNKKNIYVLRFGKMTYAYIPKNSFTKGTAEEFEQFITPLVNHNEVNKGRKILHIVLATIFVFGIIVFSISALFLGNKSTDAVYSHDYLTMTESEIKSLDDEDLYWAINARCYDKVDYDNYQQSVDELNEYQRTFIIVDTFYGDYEAGGVCEFLCDSEGVGVDELGDQLRKVGLNDVADEYEKFMQDNNLNAEHYQGVSVYKTELTKYPFDDIDQKVKQSYDNDYKKALINYIKNNLDNLV